MYIYKSFKKIKHERIKYSFYKVKSCSKQTEMFKNTHRRNEYVGMRLAQKRDSYSFHKHKHSLSLSHHKTKQFLSFSSSKENELDTISPF